MQASYGEHHWSPPKGTQFVHMYVTVVIKQCQNLNISMTVSQ